MKLFIIFKGYKKEVADLIEILEKNHHQVLYWLGHDYPARRKFPHLIFHDGATAQLGGLPDGFKLTDFPALGEDVIAKFYETESLVMTLFEKKYPEICLAKRKRIYYEMLRYWHGVMLKYQPDAIIFPTSPASVFGCVIHSLAEKMGIRMIMFFDSLIAGRTCVYQSHWEETGRRLAEQLEKNRAKIFSLDDLRQDVKNYYLAHRDKTPAATPYYTQKLSQRYSKANVLKAKIKVLSRSFVNGSFFKLIPRYLAKLIGDNPQKEYRQLEVLPDFNKKYIYLPLQFQPERSTSPLGKMFVDQILAAEILSDSLPPDWVIYLKEHPQQWWFNGINYTAHRYQGYYQKLAALKNVFLVPSNTDTFKLIDHSQIVATITGTPAWEAALRQKPALIFGYPWFRNCPGVFRVNNVASVRQVLAKITSGFKIDENLTINYLKSLDDATFECMVDDLGQEWYAPEVTGLSLNQRLNNLAHAILQELDYLKSNQKIN